MAGHERMGLLRCRYIAMRVERDPDLLQEIESEAEEGAQALGSSEDLDVLCKKFKSPALTSCAPFWQACRKASCSVAKSETIAGKDVSA